MDPNTITHCHHGVSVRAPCRLCELEADKAIAELEKLSYQPTEVKGSVWFWLFVVAALYFIFGVWFIRGHP